MDLRSAKPDFAETVCTKVDSCSSDRSIHDDSDSQQFESCEEEQVSASEGQSLRNGELEGGDDAPKIVLFKSSQSASVDFSSEQSVGCPGNVMPSFLLSKSRPRRKLLGNPVSCVSAESASTKFACIGFCPENKTMSLNAVKSISQAATDSKSIENSLPGFLSSRVEKGTTRLLQGKKSHKPDNPLKCASLEPCEKPSKKTKRTNAAAGVGDSVATPEGSLPNHGASLVCNDESVVVEISDASNGPSPASSTIHNSREHKRDMMMGPGVRRRMALKLVRAKMPGRSKSPEVAVMPSFIGKTICKLNEEKNRFNELSDCEMENREPSSGSEPKEVFEEQSSESYQQTEPAPLQTATSELKNSESQSPIISETVVNPVDIDRIRKKGRNRTNNSSSGGVYGCSDCRVTKKKPRSKGKLAHDPRSGAPPGADIPHSKTDHIIAKLNELVEYAKKTSADLTDETLWAGWADEVGLSVEECVEWYLEYGDARASSKTNCASAKRKQKSTKELEATIVKSQRNKSKNMNELANRYASAKGGDSTKWVNCLLAKNSRSGQLSCAGIKSNICATEKVGGYGALPSGDEPVVLRGNVSDSHEVSDRTGQKISSSQDEQLPRMCNSPQLKRASLGADFWMEESQDIHIGITPRASLSQVDECHSTQSVHPSKGINKKTRGHQDDIAEITRQLLFEPVKDNENTFKFIENHLAKRGYKDEAFSTKRRKRKKLLESKNFPDDDPPENQTVTDPSFVDCRLREMLRKDSKNVFREKKELLKWALEHAENEDETEALKSEFYSLHNQTGRSSVASQASSNPDNDSSLSLSDIESQCTFF